MWVRLKLELSEVLMVKVKYKVRTKQIHSNIVLSYISSSSLKSKTHRPFSLILSNIALYDAYMTH